MDSAPRTIVGNVVRLARKSAAAALTDEAQATIEALRGLLRRAHEGRVGGLAWVEFDHGRAYAVDTAGIADNDPSWVRGCVAALDDELRERVHERAMAAPDFEP